MESGQDLSNGLDVSPEEDGDYLECPGCGHEWYYEELDSEGFCPDCQGDQEDSGPCSGEEAQA